MTQTRESVFSAVQGLLPGSVFFDLFCAAGSMGIEALSRGAARAHFVEKDARALRCLEDNLDRLFVGSETARIHRGDALAFLVGEFAALSSAPFVAFADPPYDSGDAKKVLAHFDANPYPQLELLVVEHRAGALDAPTGSLQLRREKRFGDTIVSYYELQHG